MARTKVTLFGKSGQRITEVTQQGIPNHHIGFGSPEPTSEPATITPNPPTPQEQQQAEIAPVLPAFNEAYKKNRPRLIAYLTRDFYSNMSEGVALFEFADAVTEQYAPRNEITPAQWKAFTADLQTEDYDSVQWIASLKAKLYRKYENLRPPRPHTPPVGKIKVYLVDAEDGELLIYAYDELPAHWEFKWERYVKRYRCTVKVVISKTETRTFTSAQTAEVA